MSDAPPWVRLYDEATLRHELELVDVELDTLWRAVFGEEPRPTRRRRALARLWGAASTVDWSHVRPRPEPPARLTLVTDRVTRDPADL